MPLTNPGSPSPSRTYTSLTLPYLRQMLNERYTKRKQSLQKTHLHGPALPFRKTVKKVSPMGGIWALGGTWEKVPRAWTRRISASMTPPSIGTAQPAPRELPDARYDFHFQGLTRGEGEWRKTAHRTRRLRLTKLGSLFHKQSVLGLWQMLTSCTVSLSYVYPRG